MAKAPQQPLTPRFVNALGAHVLVTRHPSIDYKFAGRCTGCLDVYHGDAGWEPHEDFPEPTPASLAEARRWANEHANTCRALPQPQPEPDRLP